MVSPRTLALCKATLWDTSCAHWQASLNVIVPAHTDSMRSGVKRSAIMPFDTTPMEVVEALAVGALVCALGLWTRLTHSQRAVALLEAVEISNCVTSGLVTR
jgi:hypothetical protein